jgi:CubicO group peptidase (beta-lactamase class C family)
MSEAATQFDSIDAVVRNQMERWTVPGVAVGILHDGQVMTHAYGVTSLETGVPVRPETLFQIGSISKVFCATLVMALVDEGTVDLDTPIISYLPELRLADVEARGRITLRHCLSHTSGIYGDYFEDFGWGDDALAKAVASFDSLRQIMAPNECWFYNNAGFNLAGRVVEAVTGQTFEQAMRERVFEPLHLAHSFYFAHEAIVHSVAVGHTQVTPGEDEHELATKYPLPRCVNPAGGIIANVEDLLTFAAFHMGDGTANGKQVLAPESVRAMREPQVKAANWADEWGIGWDIRWFDGVQMLSHGGSTNGFQAQLHVVPDKSFAIAILTNSGRGSALNGTVGRWALEAYCGLAAHAAERVTLSDEQLATLAGEYRQPQAEFSVSVERNALWVKPVSISPLSGKRTEPPAYVMDPISVREFVIREGEAAGRRVDFLTDDDGNPRFIRVHGRLADRA